MPSPQTGRRKSTPKKSPSAIKNGLATEPRRGNAPRPLDIYDTNSVRSRIDKWQGFNASQQSQSNDNAPPSPSPADGAKARALRGSPVRVKHDHAEKEKAKHAEVSPPKKRLVSDGHWQKAGAQATPGNSPHAKPKGTAAAADHKHGNDHDGASTSSSPSKKENVDPGRTKYTKSVDPPKADPKADISDDALRPGPLNARNLRHWTGAPGPAPPDEEPAKKARVPPAMAYFAGRPIPEPAPKPQKQSSPPKKPADIKPTLEFFAGRPIPRINGMPLQPKKEDVRASPPKAAPAPEPRPLGRIEAWLGDSSDPFVERNDKADASDDSPRKKKDGTKRAHEAEAEEERRRRRERRRARRKQEADETPATPEPHQPDDLPKSGIDERDYAYSGSSAPSSGLKRSGAKRSSPKKPETPTKADRGMAFTSDETDAGLSDLQSIVPDDSVSMMLFRQAETQSAHHPARTPIVKENTHKTSSRALQSPVEFKVARLPPRPAEPDFPAPKRSSTKKRKTTSHADLISVLSDPAPPQGGLMSACSVRSSRSKPGESSLREVLEELKQDEAKYMSELQTLIDGVIPVLLSAALSPAAKSPAGNAQAPIPTTPIVNMGVALERLRSIHKRLPLENADAMMLWAPQAHQIYMDYIRAWRLGFQDVTVNLAPAEAAPAGAPAASEITENMDVRQKIDVAYLLKRPLVRVKYLAKTFKGIAAARDSAVSAEWSDKYHELVKAARERQTEEKARLEDEAAAATDTTRTRDPRTLAPLAGVRIDPKKCVRARDFFDLRIQHSSGQRIDCHVELILRDDINSRYPGDVLICEVNQTSRWLLLPPVKLDCISARFGEGPCELVVLTRSSQYSRTPWREMLSLQAESGQNAMDWLSMLGTDPVPPSLPETQPAQPMPEHIEKEDDGAVILALPSVPAYPSAPSEVDIPFGEPANTLAKQWDSPSSSEVHDRSKEGQRPMSRGSATPTRASRKGDSNLGENPAASARTWSPSRAARKPVETASPEKLADSVRGSSALSERPLSAQIPTSSDGALNPSSTSHTSWKPGSNRPTSLVSGLSKMFDRSPEKSSEQHSRHTPSPAPRPRSEEYPSQRPRAPQGNSDYDRMRRFARNEELSEVSSSQPPRHKAASAVSSSSSQGYSVWMPESTHEIVGETSAAGDAYSNSQSRNSSPRDHRGIDLQTEPSRPSRSSADQRHATSVSVGARPPSSYAGDRSPVRERDMPAPKTPEHRNPYSAHSPQGSSGSSNVASKRSTPAHSGPNMQFTPPRPGFIAQGRPSSPLKHEYEPSNASEESLDAHLMSADDDAVSISSNSSAEDIVPSLPPMDMFNRRRRQSESVFVPKNPATVAPSQSASQVGGGAPFVEPQTSDRKVASIFCWSAKGTWDLLFPDEVSIIVSPGLIEAYEMGAVFSGQNRSSPASGSSTGDSPHFSARPVGVAPLIGLEVTPLVPLRRGTVIDISIRSQLTKESSLKAPSENIMFRSRNVMECERLYTAINQARINNPTYIAMQNAQPMPTSNWSAYMDSRPEARPPWWRLGRKKSSYRAGSSRRTPSVAAQTNESEGSVATMSSALSALRRFTSNSKMFNVAKSTVTHGTPAGLSTPSRSSATRSSIDQAGSGASTPPAGAGMGMNAAVGAALGINGAKIRLYQREEGPKWRDLGAATLTIMQPPRPQGAPPPLTPDGRLKQEKRIVVRGHKDNVMLDLTLGEAAFERVARTGIAVSSWERMEGIGHRGSVMTMRVKVYMLQMKSEAEAAYTFSLVGRVRF